MFCLNVQVCWTYNQQRRPGPGFTGAEGVLHCAAHHQHREEHRGLHVAPRSQTSPRPGIDSHPRINYEAG